MKLGFVKSLRREKTINELIDVCTIVIDELPYTLFGHESDYIQFIGQQVLYETRPDIYEGQMITVIANIAERQVIQTVSETKGIKLIPENARTRKFINVDFDELPYGHSIDNVTVYLADYIVNSSDKAVWFDMKVVDMVSRVRTVRFFSSRGQQQEEADIIIRGLIGKYIKLDRLTHTQYGYQTNGIELYNSDIVLPPEVEVACSIIEEATANDSQLLEYMQKFDYLNKLKYVIDVEPGFHLVRCATEILLIKALSNITNIYSEQELIRAAVTSRGYLIDRKNDLSKVILNTNKILRSTLASDLTLIGVIDVASMVTNPLKRIYIEIAKFSNFVVDERRGLIDEKEVVTNLSTVSNMFGRLL